MGDSGQVDDYIGPEVVQNPGEHVVVTRIGGNEIWQFASVQEFLVSGPEKAIGCLQGVTVVDREKIDGQAFVIFQMIDQVMADEAGAADQGNSGHSFSVVSRR